MARHGINAVRTGPITDERILDTADSAGITLFREIPFYEYPAARLVDSTRAAASIVKLLIRSGRGHRSAGPIGLAVRGDVSDSNACAFFSELRETVSPEQVFYYVSSFVESDVCANQVDFVILDATDTTDPVSLLERWKSGHETPVAITVGKWVDYREGTGLQLPNSPESQARYLESTLRKILESSDHPAMFVHRWRDLDSGTQFSTVSQEDVFGRRYGLQDRDDIARPALHVTTGFFSGGQDVFALPRDADSPQPDVWVLLMGWFLIGLVAALYTSSPRFRFMTPRYFFAHGFYRNAVREAREVLPIVSTALLTVLGLSIGMIATQFLFAVYDSVPVIYLVRLMSPLAQAVITALLQSPVITMFFLGSLSLLAMTLWMGLWMIVALRRAPLLPSQALMLAVWPRWLVLLILPAVMSIHTLESTGLRVGMLIVLPFWIGSSLWAGARTAYDVYKLTRCPLWTALLGWLLHPTVLLLLALTGLAIKESSYFSYFVHLAMRS